MRIDSKKIKVVGFYRYPTFPKDVLCKYDDCFSKGRGDVFAKELYEKLITEANELSGKRLNDNKTAIEFTYDGKTTLYVCNKDYVYSICLAVRPEFDNLYIDLRKETV